MAGKHNLMAVVLGSTLLLTGTTAQAAHPLITDDAGTQGTGKVLVEFNGQYDHNDYEGVTDKTRELKVALTYGLTDTVDVVLSAPYTDWSSRSDADDKTSGRGIGDTSLEAKWRFYEQEGLSLAVKPGVTLPTGDDDKGLGAGKVTYELFFIGTQELAPWTFHLNLGYLRADNTADERENLWHASVASELELRKGLRLVANLGAERAAEKESNVHPAFLLGGVIYALTDSCDVDFGVKAGLNHAEPDYSLLAGVALKF